MKPYRGIQGRTFTIVFILILLASLAAGMIGVVRFQRVMSALDQVRRVWPPTASLLESRYHELDLRLRGQGQEPSDSSENIPSSDQLQRWEEARRQFSSSTQYDVQARYVPELETLRQTLAPASPNAQVPPPETTASLKAFLEADQHLEVLLSDPVGQIFQALVRLNIPPPIHSFLSK